MREHKHQWEPWQSTADQLGSIFPDSNGEYWRYERHCNVMGCNEIQYAEFLVTKGNIKQICNGIRTD